MLFSHLSKFIPFTNSVNNNAKWGHKKETKRSRYHLPSGINKTQQLNLREKDRVKLKASVLDIDCKEMKQMNEMIKSEFSIYHLVLPAFYKSNRMNCLLRNNRIKFHNDLQHSIIRGSIVRVTAVMMAFLSPTLKEIPRKHKRYYRMDTKSTGNYNSVHKKMNVRVTEMAIIKEIDRILVPDGRPSEHPNLLQNNSQHMSSSTPSILTLSNSYSKIFYN